MRWAAVAAVIILAYIAGLAAAWYAITHPEES